MWTQELVAYAHRRKLYNLYPPNAAPFSLHCATDHGADKARSDLPALAPALIAACIVACIVVVVNNFTCFDAKLGTYSESKLGAYHVANRKPNWFTNQSADVGTEC